MKIILHKPFVTKHSTQIPLFSLHRCIYFVNMALLAILNFPVANADTKITLNSGTREPFTTAEGGGFYGTLSKELFSRIGLDVKVIPLPSGRSIINANEGIDDGVIARTPGMDKKYKNLIMIPDPVITFKFVAYSLDEKIPVDGWDSFIPYSVGYIRGWYIYEQNLPKTKSLTVVNNAEQLFRLLMNKRTELILFEYYRGTWWNKHLNANAHLIGSPIAEKNMYIYMHKKHKDIVPKLTKALKEMKSDGTYQKIKDEMFSPLLKK